MKRKHFHPTLRLTHSHEGSTVFNEDGERLHDHYMLKTTYLHKLSNDPNAPPQHISETQTNRE